MISCLDIFNILPYIWDNLLMGHLSTLCKVSWIHFILIKFNETLILERIHALLTKKFGTVINWNTSYSLYHLFEIICIRNKDHRLDNIK